MAGILAGLGRIGKRYQHLSELKEQSKDFFIDAKKIDNDLVVWPTEAERQRKCPICLVEHPEYAKLTPEGKATMMAIFGEDAFE